MTSTRARPDAGVVRGSWHGVGFRLELPAECLAAVTPLLPAGWVDGHQDDVAVTWLLHRAEGGWRAARGDGWTARFDDVGAALTRILGDLELHLAEQAQDLVAVHAGVVAWRGHALVLPGRSMAGKSTLVHRLVRAGAQYCSDEYALLTPEGFVLPYPRALSLRPAGPGAPERVPVERLGSVAAGPLPLGAVAHLRYVPGAGWDVGPMSPGSAALAMVDNAVAARSRPVEVLDHVCAAVSGVLSVHGVRGEADDAAGRLLDLLSKSLPGPVSTVLGAGSPVRAGPAG